MSIKPFIPPQMAARSDDPRLGECVQFSTNGQITATTRLAIIGFPSDEGVRLNGGRVGAKDGPAALRNALYRLTPDATNSTKHAQLLRATVDVGDLIISGNVATDQSLLADIIGPWLMRGIVVVVLGGGHETTYGHFLAYAQNQRPIKLLNIDAHPDVRPDPSPHSGNSFRLALEHPSHSCADYTVMGLNRHSAARAHLDYIAQRNGSVVFASEFERSHIDQYFGHYFGPRPNATAISFDLDALNQAHAPGVSAPNAYGIDPKVWLHAAYCAGRCTHVSSLDIVELNPRCDQSDTTARIAALTVWEFTRGLVQRP